MNTRRLPKERSQSRARGAGAEARGGGPEPADVVRAAEASLKAAGDPAFARQLRSYFKSHERVVAYGVRTPRFRAIAAELYSQVRGAWGFEEAVVFADLCLAKSVFELRGAGIDLLGRFEAAFQPSLLAQVRRWLEANRLDNWAAVDSCAGAVVSPLLARYPALVPRIARWSSSPNLWTRRMSVVPLVPFARRGEHLEAAYGVVERLLGDPEDLMHKATGWLLREAGKTDAARLEAFLLHHGPALPRTALRYAIERFPAADRKRLLAATRGRPPA